MSREEFDKKFAGSGDSSSGSGGGGGGFDPTRYPPRRFYMRKGESRKLVFVDWLNNDGGQPIQEYQLRIAGDWKNWFTHNSRPDDPTTQALLQVHKAEDVKRMLKDVYYTTVVVDNPWTDKDGNPHNFGIELHGAKFYTYQKFVQDRDKGRDYEGHLVGFDRVDSPQSPGAGMTDQIERQVDMAKVFEYAEYQGRKIKDLYERAENDPDFMAKLKKVFSLEFDDDGNLIHKLVPFNYAETLKPKSEDEVREAMRMYDGPGQIKRADNGSSGSPDVGGFDNNVTRQLSDPEIPF